MVFFFFCFFFFAAAGHERGSGASETLQYAGRHPSRPQVDGGLSTDPEPGTRAVRGGPRRPRGSILTRYFDASALVKRYVREPGAVSVRRLLKSDPAAASRLSEVEVASALVRRAREGAFTLEERDRALASLADDFATLIIVEFTAEITVDARALLLRHRLRAGDAVQLASCLYLQREMSQPLPLGGRQTIGLREAARQEGLTVVSASKGRR